MRKGLEEALEALSLELAAAMGETVAELRANGGVGAGDLKKLTSALRDLAGMAEEEAGEEEGGVVWLPPAPKKQDG